MLKHVILAILVVLSFSFMAFGVWANGVLSVVGLLNLVLIFALLIILPAMGISALRAMIPVRDRVLYPVHSSTLLVYVSWFSVIALLLLGLLVYAMWDDGLDVHLQIVGGSVFFMLGIAFHAGTILLTTALFGKLFRPIKPGLSLNSMLIAYLISLLVCYDLTLGNGLLEFMFFVIPMEINPLLKTSVHMMGSAAQFF